MCYVTDAIDARGELKRGLDLVCVAGLESADNTSGEPRVEREHVCDGLVS